MVDSTVSMSWDWGTKWVHAILKIIRYPGTWEGHSTQHFPWHQKEIRQALSSQENWSSKQHIYYMYPMGSQEKWQSGACSEVLMRRAPNFWSPNIYSSPAWCLLESRVALDVMPSSTAKLLDVLWRMGREESPQGIEHCDRSVVQSLLNFTRDN